jgi:hypothetical protein
MEQYIQQPACAKEAASWLHTVATEAERAAVMALLTGLKASQPNGAASEPVSEQTSTVVHSDRKPEADTATSKICGSSGPKSGEHLRNLG